MTDSDRGDSAPLDVHQPDGRQAADGRSPGKPSITCSEAVAWLA